MSYQLTVQRYTHHSSIEIEPPFTNVHHAQLLSHPLMGKYLPSSGQDDGVILEVERQNRFASTSEMHSYVMRAAQLIKVALEDIGAETLPTIDARARFVGKWIQ